jgi:hypothetical protein
MARAAAEAEPVSAIPRLLAMRDRDFARQQQGRARPAPLFADGWCHDAYDGAAAASMARV